MCGRAVRISVLNQPSALAHSWGGVFFALRVPAIPVVSVRARAGKVCAVLVVGPPVGPRQKGEEERGKSYCIRQVWKKRPMSVALVIAFFIAVRVLSFWGIIYFGEHGMVGGSRERGRIGGRGEAVEGGHWGIQTGVPVL